MLQERNAILHSLHRALITSPAAGRDIPDTTFTFSILDTPRNNSWSFSRSNDPEVLKEGNYWVMPHFSGWSWPKPFIGPLDDALRKITGIEKDFDGQWRNKIDKVVWRGTGWFNSAGNVNLRPDLLAKTTAKEWADVQAMEWIMNGERANNSIPIQEFCRYKYIIYTEVSFPLSNQQLFPLAVDGRKEEVSLMADEDSK